MSNTKTIPWLRTRLSAQMFLQFAIWGAWAPVLANHLNHLKFTGEQIGFVYLTGALGTAISPLIAGQIADRWFSTERFLGVSYLMTGAMLYLMADATAYADVWWLALAGMLFFGPTLGLANALSFHHLENAERDFPRVRLFGTIGWIAANWILSWWLEGADDRPWADCLRLGAIFAALNGLYCFSLPHTPPRGEAQERFAVGKVLKMLADPSFSVFSAVAFLLLVFATFYYTFAGLFFEVGLKLTKEQVPRVASIGQTMEIVMMWILPFFLLRLGFKTTIAIGIAAWGLRFGIFALGEPTALVIVSQGLHGVCFAFAIAAAMIYVERISPKDVRGSAQSFLAFMTYGLGMIVGNISCAKVAGHYGQYWQGIWTVPAAGCFVALLIFLIGFKARDKQES
ncbi:MAG: MFS transporter [Planctomycetota bacterium]|nr:MFS transporter [Planctomycetota bacterium]